MTIEIHGYSQLYLCGLFYSCFYAHEVVFRTLQFPRLFTVRFMRALENSLHSDLNAYAVLTVFMQTLQSTNFATQKEELQ